jgi:hypothetical protein
VRACHAYDRRITTVRCRRCGTAADAPLGSVPLDWSTAASDDEIDAFCDRCTREHVRDIEGKLDEEWWA